MLDTKRKVFEPNKLSRMPTPGVDPVGSVFGYGDRIFRRITCAQHAKIYRDLFTQDWFQQTFSKGLIETWISEEFESEDDSLLLEHRRLPFSVEPCEWTAIMHWQAAKSMIRLNIALSVHGLLLKDAHPWNLMYYKGEPIFVDFSSITESSCISSAWFDEFRRYFASAIWLACTPMKSLALEYRREHIQGFGIKLFESVISRKIALRDLDKLRKYRDFPSTFLQKLDHWLDRHKPDAAKPEYWSHYVQTSHSNDFLLAYSDKQKFVLNSLKALQPETVLDCAANKGYYAAMAASLGASVAAFDYEEECVDQCLSLAVENDLDITPALMNFLFPTPQYGMGLVGKNAFERFESDVVLAMGLIHHACIRQEMPVKLFCETCIHYAQKAILLEFVEPDDKHVALWNKKIPLDYSLNSIISYCAEKFPNYKKYDYIENGIQRSYLCFFE